MYIEQIRKAYDAKPFQPFVLHVADGRAVRVDSPEFILLPATGRHAVVWQADDSLHVLDVLLITDMEVKLSPNGPGKRRRS